MNKLLKVIGAEHNLVLATGKKKRVVLLNNAATTPPFESTLKEVNHFLQTYSTFHRGSGPHANITYTKVQEAISIIRQFLNLPESHTLLFTQNTTIAINLFARMLSLKESDVIITSPIEHASNNLPWHYNTKAEVIEIAVFDDGSFDYDDMKQKATKYSQNLKLIAITGASNQTGYLPDIKRLSRIAHQHDALLFIDAAQLVPHRQVDMQQDGIDALAFSAHKIYAPFGIGVLALPKSMLDMIPVDPGGGSVEIISEGDVVWASPQERHQSGTWNVTGIIALAASCQAIMNVGWKKVEEHEHDLVKYTAKKLADVPKIKLYVPFERYLTEDRTGIFPFNLDGLHHVLVAAILEHEYGIEVRAGTACDNRLVRRWFNISDSQQKEIEQQIIAGNHLVAYGVVRVSLGIHNTREDIDLLVDALTNIVKYGPKLKYKEMPDKGIFVPIRP